jgi:rSAM/selenodomain-associated transferase 2
MAHPGAGPAADVQLSIIVPVLNESGIVARGLASLQALRRAGHEVIVVDGGSSDDTVALAAPYADRLLSSARGRAAQLNAGARCAAGAVLLFLHADCVPPAAADRLIFDGMAASGAHWGRFDVRLSGAHWLLRVVETAMNWRSRLTGIATGDQGIFVEVALFRKVGEFPQIALMEDIALCRALRRHERPLCIATPVIASSRRWEQNGIVKTILLMWRLRLAYWLGADPAALARRYRTGGA